MKRKKFFLTDLNHLGANHFSILRDPHFGNRCSHITVTVGDPFKSKYLCITMAVGVPYEKGNLNIAVDVGGPFENRVRAYDLLRSRDRPIYRADIWVLPIYRYWPKRPILSPSVGVDKTLLYSSRIQTTSVRKHNDPSQDSYLAGPLAGAFSWTSRQDEPWSTCPPSQSNQNRHH